MDMVAYQIFLKLAETRHFGRTAALCALSPSAVSRHLQRLETRVGQRLVDRDNRQVHLTPAGWHFLEYARKSVDAWQQLRTDLSANQNTLNGEVSVFGSVTASYSMLTQILPGMREAYPGVELKLRTGDQADGVARVLEGREDSAIIGKPDRLPDRLQFLPLRQTPLVLIGPRTPSALARHLDACRVEALEPDWNTVPMVLAERGLARERLLKRLQDNGQKPNLYAQVAGHEAVVSMVSLGFGVAIVPQLVIEHSPKQETIRMLPWLDDLAPFELGLCALRHRLKDALLQAFWSCAAQTYPQSA
ncbi:MAG: LysR family positive regulator for ilvC [Gammaproteobacteria bacterium]|jgi:LysR family positive regulator for ilvC